jgi:DNA transposition AAA+ family ATPase
MNFAKTSALQNIAAHHNLLASRPVTSARMGIVTGDPGFGKTSALKFLADQTNAAYILPYSGITQFGVISQILSALNLPQGLFLRNCVEILFEDLSKREANFTLLVDEGDFLDTKSLEFIRSIHDKYSIVTILAGHTRLSSRIKKYPQIKDRLMPLSIRPGTNDDAHLLADFISNGIDFIAPELVDAVYGQIGGNLRRLDEQFTLIKTYSEELGHVQIGLGLWEKNLVSRKAA